MISPILAQNTHCSWLSVPKIFVSVTPLPVTDLTPEIIGFKNGYHKTSRMGTSCFRWGSLVESNTPFLFRRLIIIKGSLHLHVRRCKKAYIGLKRGKTKWGHVDPLLSRWYVCRKSLALAIANFRYCLGNGLTKAACHNYERYSHFQCIAGL